MDNSEPQSINKPTFPSWGVGLIVTLAGIGIILFQYFRIRYSNRYLVGGTDTGVGAILIGLVLLLKPHFFKFKNAAGAYSGKLAMLKMLWQQTTVIQKIIIAVIITTSFIVGKILLNYFITITGHYYE